MPKEAPDPDPALSYRLRLPGPTAVPERVQQAISRPLVNHRGPEFRALYGRVQELVRPIMETANPVFVFAGTGTGMMEASLANILAPGERVLVVVNGQFGERFAAIAEALGAQVDRLEIPWGRVVAPEQIVSEVAKADYRAVVVVHNESSTGMVTDIAGIGGILRELPTLLVVDSVSGLAGLPMRQDEWGIDILISASQKCLMSPPGIGLASVSAKAWQIVSREDRLPRFYWDFRKARVTAEKSETPFTAPVSLVAGLKEALEMIHEETLPYVLERHRRLAGALRAGCAAMGLTSFGQESARSSTVVVMELPAKLNGADIVRRLYERHRTVIAGARNRLAGRIIRIGVMGYVHEADILLDLEHLESVLGELGWPVTRGAGMSAAERVLAL
jgi:aspartate aminotransferase-like enzyme